VLHTGEGRDCIDSKTGWYIEDLSGWLISADEINDFVKASENGTVYDIFSNSYVFVIWRKDKNGQVNIDFKKY